MSIEEDIMLWNSFKDDNDFSPFAKAKAIAKMAHASMMYDDEPYYEMISIQIEEPLN